MFCINGYFNIFTYIEGQHPVISASVLLLKLYQLRNLKAWEPLEHVKSIRRPRPAKSAVVLCHSVFWNVPGQKLAAISFVLRVPEGTHTAGGGQAAQEGGFPLNLPGFGIPEGWGPAGSTRDQELLPSTSVLSLRTRKASFSLLVS